VEELISSNHGLGIECTMEWTLNWFKGAIPLLVKFLVAWQAKQLSMLSHHNLLTMTLGVCFVRLFLPELGQSSSGRRQDKNM
jgi:hypothetical protein